MYSPSSNSHHPQSSASGTLLLGLLLLTGTAFLPFCKKEVVATPKPILELIAKQTNCTCEPYIDQYSWKNKTVYVLSCKGPACFCGAEYYNAQGQVMVTGQDYSLNRFREEAAFTKHVWSCKEE